MDVDHHHHHHSHHNGETNIENLELKHADSDSANSIPPPPPPMGMVVPVASEESDDITEAERFKQQELEHDLQMAPSEKQEEELLEKEEEGIRAEFKCGREAVTTVSSAFTGPSNCLSITDSISCQILSTRTAVSPSVSVGGALVARIMAVRHSRYLAKGDAAVFVLGPRHSPPIGTAISKIITRCNEGLISSPARPFNYLLGAKMLKERLDSDLDMKQDSQSELSENPENQDGHTSDVAVVDEDGQSESCCSKFVKCLGNIPCPSLLSWIALLFGIGCFTGGLLVATWRTRDLLDADSMLWFMEYTIIGIDVGMFVVLSLVLLTGHLSSEPTSRHIFNSLSKNKCARALNIVVMIICYFLAAIWVLATALLATPLVFLTNFFIVDGDSFNTNQFGFRDYEYTGTDLDNFRDDSKTLLICYGVAFLGAFFIVNSLIFFIMCISANITHLRDNRFAALNAYGAEEVHNSKHSVVDTNM